MTNKTYLNWNKAGTLLHEVMRSMKGWQPDYVVGIVRGGCFPAGMYSHYAGVPMYALKVQLADGAGENKEDDTECNAWMAEDAINGKNILLMDDINDSGKTLNWIKADWRQSANPTDIRWQNDLIFGHNVKTACLIENGPSEFESDYTGMTVSYTHLTLPPIYSV